MQGTIKNDQKGLVPNTFDQIFEEIYDSPENIEFIVKISMFEIYMENIKDLLNKKATKKVKIRQSPKAGVYLENITAICVADELEMNSIY